MQDSSRTIFLKNSCSRRVFRRLNLKFGKRARSGFLEKISFLRRGNFNAQKKFAWGKSLRGAGKQKSPRLFFALCVILSLGAGKIRCLRVALCGGRFRAILKGGMGDAKILPIQYGAFCCLRINTQIDFLSRRFVGRFFAARAVLDVWF